MCQEASAAPMREMVELTLPARARRAVEPPAREQMAAPIALARRGAIGAAAFILLMLTLLAGCGPDGVPGREIVFDDQGAQLWRTGDRRHPAYNSSPPTSGAYWEYPVSNRFLPGQLDPEIQVGLLRRGVVLIQYRCDNCPVLLARLWRLAAARDDIVVAPNRRDLKAPIVLTAWTRLLELDAWDETAALTFIDRYAGRGAPR